MGVDTIPVKARSPFFAAPHLDDDNGAVGGTSKGCMPLHWVASSDLA